MVSNKSFSVLVLALTLFFFFLIQSPSKALASTTYYVSTSGNDSNTGSITSPFRTITKGIAVAAPGDTIFVRSGTYPHFTITKSGTAGNYIKISSYNNETVVISGNSYDGILLKGTSYVHIYGLEVTGATGAYGAGISVTNNGSTFPTYNIIENNKVHDNVGTYTQGIQVTDGSHNKILNNKSYRNYYSGIIVASLASVSPNGVTGNEIIGNEVYDNTLGGGNTDGIKVEGAGTRNTLITNNIVHGNGDDGIDTWNSSQNTLIGNTSYSQLGPGDGNGFKLGGLTNGVSTGGNNIIKQNISYGNKYNGFESNGSGANYYEGNIAYNNGAWGFQDSWRTNGDTRPSSLINNNSYLNTRENYIKGVYTTVFTGNTETIPSTSGNSLYVATNGSDATGTGAIDKPFATITKAQNYVSPGTTVYVRGGTYTSPFVLTTGSGSSTQPVTYRPYPNERVVIDGSNLANNSASLIHLYSLHDINIIGFEAAHKRGNGRGISFTDCTNILIQNNKVYDIGQRAIGGSGDNITIDNNEVYDAANINVNNTAYPNGGWAGVVSSHSKSNGNASTNFVISNNHIYDSWGEGIIAMQVNGATISGNRIHDTFSVLLYAGNASNIKMTGNYLTATNTRFFRNGYPANGINMAPEACCVSNPSLLMDNYLIANNLIVNTRAGIRYWSGDYNNPYTNLKIYHNTIANSLEGPGIYLDSVPSTHGNELRNNIIYGGSDISNTSSWVFSNNNWPNGKPSMDNSSSSFSANPLFVNPVIGGPVDGYKLQASSSSIGKGIPVSVVTKDYFGTTRNNPSTVGFYEYTGTIQPSPSPLYNVADLEPDGDIDVADYNILVSNFGLTGALGWIRSDILRNGVVDIFDYNLLITNFGQ